jgi:putative colanic acid biosynthesis glycosyltransferase
MTAPLLSIVTVTWNNDAGLSKTVDSCARLLDDPRVELVIVDGASTDGTSSRLVALRDRPGWNVVVLSERDCGIYDAMNKGIALARGRHVIFMNAGDRFDDTFTVDPSSLQADTVYYGDARFQSADGGFAKHYRIDRVGSFLNHNTFSHQAIFYPRALLQSLGGYDLSFTVSADFDLTLECFQRAPFRALDRTVCVCELGGFSHVNGWRSYTDRMRSLRKNGETRLWAALLLYAPVFFAKHRIVKALDGSRLLAWYRSVRHG